MNKKHFWGMLLVLLITGFVFYQELKTTSFSAMVKAFKDLNIGFLVLVLMVMLLSYVCEAAILAILAKRPHEPHHGMWAFFRVPLIQALFNAITPMSTGGQPSQLAALVQMGIEGGRATSLLLMKFIIYQIVVFFAYVWTILFGFHIVAAKFSALAIFIAIGFIIHVVSILFLISILFAYRTTKRVTLWLLKQLTHFFSEEKVSKWRKALLEKIETFYAEGQKLKKEKGKLIWSVVLTVAQLLCFYSIPYLVLLALNLTPSWLDVTQMNIMIIMFMAIIPIPGASGGAEYSFQTLFSTFIKSSTDLVLGMFIWRFATYFLGILLGLFGWFFKPTKKCRS